ncbi:MAG: tRNA 2-thiouridine(34) synthase MnmA [Candidatus Nanopelagicales bacterium]|nr:tRNA 2-thiouridine(34) synthase MnmA [Candidatus Nanopelagicales bacterium]
MKRVVAAMSGGVDSAVAAARLVDAGYEVTGVHLALAEKRYAGGGRGCCTLEDVHDARRAADRLGIPFYVWDFAERFQQTVLDDFLHEYSQGRTPNPCVSCNQHIKFAAVLERAQALGFDAVGTGHYARLVEGPDGPELHRAADPEKDQSYVLGVLDADQLAGSLFPLGDSHKAQVRAEAADRGLLVADKPDSHDICFIPDGDTRGFLRERLGGQDGPIVDATSGEQLGSHSGAVGFTIGQRRGLHLQQPAADGQPRYIVDVDLERNTVFVDRRGPCADPRARPTGTGPLHDRPRRAARAVVGCCPRSDRCALSRHPGARFGPDHPHVLVRRLALLISPPHEVGRALLWMPLLCG